MADKSAEYEQTAVIEQKLKLFGIPMQRDTAYYLVDIICLLLLIASFLFVAIAVDWDAYVWRFYVGVGCLMIFCIILAEVNHHNRFNFMTTYFHRYRYTLCVIFFTIAIVDFVLLELSDVGSDCDWDDPDLVSNCPPLNPDEGGVRYWTRSLTILSAILFIFCVLGYWERVSYISAHNSWVSAMLYMSVVGGIFLHVARCLEPPPQTAEERRYNWSWHQSHSKNSVFKIVVNIMIVVVLFFVVMGSIVLAFFGDASRSSEALGTWAAMIIFIIIAHMIMITPLAPGSVVDVCAGFLFVSLFVNNEGASIEASYVVSLALTIALHFSGSCSQYYVGKISAVQIWANKTLPPEMLAASDSVLKTANWFKVGVVGQVFMDTANGLNQGRMDMAFCTQFWSEYASIPNAIGLVSLGTILAIPSFGDTEDYEWAEKAIPLVVMITSLWQMIASSWGAKELLASSDTVSYWTAYEKWATVQHFYSIGYVPTHEGWKEDVYELGTGKNGTALFDAVHEYRLTELQRTESNFKTTFNPKEDMRKCGEFCRSLCREPTNPTEQRELVRHTKELEDKSSELRKQHWQRIEERLDELLENEENKAYLRRVTPPKTITNVFADSDGAKFIIHLIMTVAIFGTGIGSYVLIARNVELSEAVKQGASVLGSANVSSVGWLCFGLFWLLVIIYFHREFHYDLKEMGQSIAFVFKGCKHIELGADIETVFNPPFWDDGPQEYEEWVKKTTVFVEEPLDTEV